MLISGISLVSAASAQNNTDAVRAGKNIAVVETDNGKLRGYIHDGIYTYKGIPYAHADRFMAPVKPAHWDGVRTALSYGPVCPTDAVTTENDEGEFPFQHNWGYMNENCQVLNVWSPRINDGQKRPVMVWFHGGGFTNGSSIEQPGYDSENLARTGNVVVVTVNHRLNVLGFLDLSGFGDKYKNSANAGLLDLQMALQWVKQNIAQFGGDPGNVTIFGQSGGGGKVTCLMNAPSAKGLFQKAIVESGSYLNTFPDKSATQRIGKALLEALGLQPSQIDSLQTIPYERLNAASKRAIRKVATEMRAEGKPAPGGWGPSLDGTFLPYQPNDPAALALSRDIPLLVGTTKNEFTPFNPALRNLTMEQVKSDLQKKYGDKYEAYMAAVKKAYPNTSKPSEYEDVEINFRQGALRQADLKSSAGGAPVYNYVFAWQSPVNDGIYKAMHCMEIPFVFNNIKRCEEMTGGGKGAYAMATKVSGAWVNFARTGNPNTVGLPKWPAYTQQNGATMIFDNQSRVGNHFDEELLKMASGK